MATRKFSKHRYLPTLFFPSRHGAFSHRVPKTHLSDELSATVTARLANSIIMTVFLNLSGVIGIDCVLGEKEVVVDVNPDELQLHMGCLACVAALVKCSKFFKKKIRDS